MIIPASIELGPIPYTAQGVFFQGSIQGLGPTYLITTALECLDNGSYSFSFWQQGLQQTFNNSCTLFVTDPFNGYNPNANTSGNRLVSSFSFAIDALNINWIPTFTLNDNNWHHYLGSFFTDRPSGSKIGAFYIDDLFIVPNTFSDTGGASIQPVNGLPFVLGDDVVNLSSNPTLGFGPTVALSDVWIAPGINLLAQDADGNTQPYIAGAQRQIFTTLLGVPQEEVRQPFGNTESGILVPNNPQTFPQAPIIFSGGPNTFGINQGFGGGFALTGELSGTLGPGGIPT